MQAQEVVPQQDAATCAMALGENGHMVPLIETQTKAEGDANRHPKGPKGCHPWCVMATTPDWVLRKSHDEVPG